MHQYLVNVVCKDQTGLIAQISGALFDLGINLGSTHFALLGEGAEFSAVCETENHILEEDIMEQLRNIENMEDAQITIKPFEHAANKPDNAKISHHIIIDGGDHAGLIARLSEVFIEFDGNIVRMITEKHLAKPHNLYHIEIDAYIPPERADACLATLSNTASSLGMQFQQESAES